MPRRLPAPTKEQQGHLRHKAMQIAGIGLAQMKEYLETGFIKVGDNEVTMTNERLNTIKMALGKCVPDMHHTEVEHSKSYESLSTDDLILKLAAMASERPALAARLNEVIGGKLIQGQSDRVPDMVEDHTSANETLDAVESLEGS